MNDVVAVAPAARRVPRQRLPGRRSSSARASPRSSSRPATPASQLFENAAATAAGLFAIILMFGPVSGGHFNPVVSFVDAGFGGLCVARRARPTSRPRSRVASAAPSSPTSCSRRAAIEHLDQAPGVAGPLPLRDRRHPRSAARDLRPGPLRARSRTAPAAVGAYIGAAYFFTSSTSFANPAITVGRMFSNTFAGIAPSSAPTFIGAQVVGGVVAFGVIRVLYPGVTPDEAADIVVPAPREGCRRIPRPNGSRNRTCAEAEPPWIRPSPDRAAPTKGDPCTSSPSAAATPASAPPCGHGARPSRRRDRRRGRRLPELLHLRHPLLRLGRGRPTGATWPTAPIADLEATGMTAAPRHTGHRDRRRRSQAARASVATGPRSSSPTTPWSSGPAPSRSALRSKAAGRCPRARRRCSSPALDGRHLRRHAHPRGDGARQRRHRRAPATSASRWPRRSWPAAGGDPDRAARRGAPDRRPRARCARARRAAPSTVSTSAPGPPCSRIERPDGGDGRLEVDAIGADGAECPCPTDMVLVVVGVRPDTELAASAGAKLGLRGAIAVDRRCGRTCPTCSPPATASSPTTGCSARPTSRSARPPTSRVGWPARTPWAGS